MEITEEQLNKIFELASVPKKKDNSQITSKDITAALIAIERKIYSFSSELKVDSLEDKKILIADDLELSIYQLSTVLKRIGIIPTIARSKKEAISFLQKVHFDCVIVDLFIPDSSDGIEIIQDAVNKRNEIDAYCNLVVISGTDDTSLIDKCYEMGIDLYIKKDKDWHSKLLKYLSTAFQTDKNVAFTKYVINNNIASYLIKRFNDEKVYDTIQKNVNASMYTGIKHVIFDLKEITTFDSDNVSIFADIYRVCSENGGKFVLINPSENIKEALSFAYLDEAIIYTNSVEEAVNLIEKSEVNSQ